MGTRRRWLALALGAGAMFAALAVATLRWGAFETLDGRAAAALARLDAPWWRALMEGLSVLHAPRGIVVMTLAAALGWAARREFAAALVLLAAVGGGAALNHLAKHTLQRPRPGLEAALAGATDFAFPSGHVANTTLLYGTLAVLLLARVRSPGRRRAIALAAAMLIAAVAASRLALGAHRASDVLAAVPLAVGWLALCQAVLPGARR